MHHKKNTTPLTIGKLQSFIKDLTENTLIGVELDNGDYGIIDEVYSTRDGLIFKIKTEK